MLNLAKGQFQNMVKSGDDSKRGVDLCRDFPSFGPDATITLADEGKPEESAGDQ